MKRLFFTFALLMEGLGAFASEESKYVFLQFEEIPFVEGKIYVALSYEGSEIFKSVVEVDSEIITLPVALSEYIRKEIDIKAFQDLNQNRTLDFDSYGHPQEPCLQTKREVESEESIINLKLIQY